MLKFVHFFRRPPTPPSTSRHHHAPHRHTPLLVDRAVLHIGHGRHAAIVMSASHSTHTARWLHGTYRQLAALVVHAHHAEVAVGAVVVVVHAVVGVRMAARGRRR